MVEWSKEKTTVDKEVHLYPPEERHAFFFSMGYSDLVLSLCFSFFPS